MFDTFLSTLIVSMLNVYEFLFYVFPAVSGAAAVFCLAAARSENRIRAAIYAGLTVPGLVAFGLCLLLPLLIGWYKNQGFSFPQWHIYAIGLQAFAGVVAAFLWFRYGARSADRLAASFTLKSALERNRKTDIREIGKFLPAERKLFDPRKYFDQARGMFVGLDEKWKPVYIAYAVWCVSHVLLTGRTRSGKGVVAQALLAQAILRKEFVIVLDPKIDNWMPHTFSATARECGQPYVYLDLNPSAPGQLNIFEGCNEETLENMLIGAFGLAEKGEAADFYRLADRKAARQLASWLAAEHAKTGMMPTPREAVKTFGGEWEKDAPAFAAYMSELAEIPAVNRQEGGVDLIALEHSGGCLYTVGDMTNTRVLRLQRMLLVRLLFLAKTRDYLNGEPRLMTVFADEFKAHISRPFIMSLGASLGWRLHCILAFQSLQDLADCPADLDKDSVKGSVMENCGIQLSYQIKDPDTREWLARSTGTILVDDESRRIEKNIALAETLDGERTIRQGERYLVDENIFGSLPVTDMQRKICGCSVLAIAGQLAQYCYTAAVPTQREAAAITPTHATPPPAEGEQKQTASGSIADDLVSLD